MNFLPHNAYRDFDPTPFPVKIEGWNSQHPIFRRLIEQVRPKLIVEVGTWLGASAIHMAEMCEELGLMNTKIVCVDTWLGAESDYTYGLQVAQGAMNYKNGFPQLYQQFLSNVIQTGHQDRIIPFPQTSHVAARVFNYYNVKADLIYIDGSHDEESVFSDIWNWNQQLSKNGVIFGDDYDHLDVANAVQMYALSGDNLQIDGVKWQMKRS